MAVIFEDIMIEQLFPSGAWEFRYRTEDGELITRTYFGMSKAEAAYYFEDLLDSMASMTKLG